MSIELDKKEGRQKYLEDRLNDLLIGVNDIYGKGLMDELVSRMRTTIQDFNNEIDALMGHLKDTTEKKDEIMVNLLHNLPPIEKDKEISALKADALSEWEKRLESIEN